VPSSHERGAASVEQAGLALLVMLLFAVAIAAAGSGPVDGGRELGSAVARKLRCAARAPAPCWRDPLTEAYGRSLAGAVRALAPAPVALPGSGATSLLPVDFRYCRRASCAAPGSRSPALTASNRRTTAFVSVDDRRRSSGQVTISYWLYRPTLGWELTRRRADSARVAALQRTSLLETDVPVLVSLETLDGRNHYRFAPDEEPPWRWRVQGLYP
jgi:hypothetical protein